jgi:hypothetical protein
MATKFCGKYLEEVSENDWWYVFPADPGMNFEAGWNGRGCACGSGSQGEEPKLWVRVCPRCARRLGYIW